MQFRVPAKYEVLSLTYTWIFYIFRSKPPYFVINTDILVQLFSSAILIFART